MVVVEARLAVSCHQRAPSSTHLGTSVKVRGQRAGRQGGREEEGREQRDQLSRL